MLSALTSLWYFYLTLNDPHLLTDLQTKYGDAFRKTPEILLNYGYASETHDIITEDGYILTTHRIPYDKRSPNYKGPVILNHGLCTSSSLWTLSGPKRSFAFLLNDAGYDVWLTNMRGNSYSKSHVNASREGTEFWDFSWHEAGMYDLPAVIDHVLKESESSDTIFIGFSMGSTTSYVLLSMKPEYNNKIRMLVSLTPVSQLSHSKSTFLNAMYIIIAHQRDLLKMFGIREFSAWQVLPLTERLVLCEEYSPTHELCNWIYAYIMGSSQINQTHVPVIASHFPDDASIDMLAHYGQGIITGIFRQFDFGPTENLRLYGQDQPPVYPLKNVVAPTYLYYGNDDILATAVDVEITAKLLGNVVKIYGVPNTGHSDFAFGVEADNLVYKVVMEDMLKYPMKNNVP